MSARTVAAAFSASLALCLAAQTHARELTSGFLNGTAPLTAPVAMAQYTPKTEAAPMHRFEGRLRLSVAAGGGAMAVHHDLYGLARTAADALARLPPFDFEFVQDGDALIPARRGVTPSDHPHWEFILEPGRVWSEPEDGGLTRAVLPFSLAERNANCVHNGVLMFVFDGEQASRAAYQISAETCAYFKADVWGVLPATYIKAEVAQATQLIAAHSREVAARLPVWPIAALARDFPNVRPDRFGDAAEIPPVDMTAFGFVVDGKHYVGGCETRHGPYPFCDVLTLPSYSLAKSLVAGLAAMRLERLYPGVLALKIRDYAPECADRSRWGDVTFENALDMATGAYTSALYDADERATDARFFLAEDHATKIAIACRAHRKRAPAGTLWTYHTTDTYVLGAALNEFVKRKIGRGADLYDSVLARPLWRALELSPLLDTTRRTRDARQQPLTGWGLMMHRDDVARIAHFLNTDRGRLHGEAFFDPRSFAAAMQREPADRGLPAIDASFRYNNGFWAHDVSRRLGCAQAMWVPYMAGFGGINVLLLPNDAVYYYFSDGGVFRFKEALIEAHRLRPLCKIDS